MNVIGNRGVNSAYFREISSADAPDLRPKDVFEADDKNNMVRRYAKSGARFGFKIGCAMAIFGAPLATKLSEAEGRGKKARQAKRQLPLFTIVALPSLPVGALCAGLGAVIGAAAGAMKLSKQNRSAHG